MLRCPHCKRAGIGILGKLISSEMMPARCRACGQLSALSSFPARLLKELFFLTLIAVGVIAIRKASLMLLFGGVAMVGALWTTGLLLMPVAALKRRGSPLRRDSSQPVKFRS